MMMFSVVKNWNLRVVTVVLSIVTITPHIARSQSDTENRANGGLAARIRFPQESKTMASRMEELFKTQVREWLPQLGSINQDLGSFSLQNPFPTEVSAVRLRASLISRLSALGDALQFEGQLADTVLSIGKLSVHTWVEVKVGGVNARLRLDADCTNIEARWAREKLGVFGRIRLGLDGAFPQILVSDVALSALLPDPELSMVCQGPVGVDATLKETALKLIRERIESGALQADFASALTKTANAWIDSKIQTRSYDAKTRRWDVLVAVAKSARRVSEPHVWPRAPKTEAQTDRLSIQIDRTELERFATAVFRPGSWFSRVDAKSIEGFRNLMRSRFLQFFVFPELMKFPKSTAFQLSFVNETPILAKCERSNRLRLSGQVGAWLVDEKNTPIVFFRAPFNARVQTDQRRVTDAKVSLSSIFDENYVKSHRANTSIATELFEGPIESAAKEIDLKKWLPAPLKCVDSETLEIQ